MRVNILGGAGGGSRVRIRHLTPWILGKRGGIQGSLTVKYCKNPTLKINKYYFFMIIIITVFDVVELQLHMYRNK